VRYRQVKEQGGRYPTSLMCRALRVSSSGYYAWRGRPESRSKSEDRRLLTEIRASFEASGRRYGSPRVHKDLREEGIPCGRHRVARLMRDSGLRATPRRRYLATTDSAHCYAVTANLLDRRFEVKGVNRVWAADITYVGTEEGWLYVAALMDLCSRRIVGWSASTSLDRRFTVEALRKALVLRSPEPGLLHHSDRGSQYASWEYQTLLAKAGAVPSMSRKGDCWDNAPMESFFASLKRELVRRRRYWTRAEAMEDLRGYIEGFYNRRRRHSALGGVSPADFEEALSVT